jgi:hypothetical protein
LDVGLTETGDFAIEAVEVGGEVERGAEHGRGFRVQGSESWIAEEGE